VLIAAREKERVMAEMARRSVLACFAASMAGCALARNGDVSAAAPSTDALQERLDGYFAPLAQRHCFSGVIRVESALGVVAEGRYGRANWETGAPHTGATLYGAGSVTKGITAALVTELARDGVLGLDDAVRRHLSAFTLSDQITIGQVLKHTAGLPRDAPSAVAVGEHDLVAWLNTQPLAAAPGAERNYSNVGYELLALMVETAAGRRFEEVAEARVLRPAGMNASTITRGVVSDVARASAGYVSGPQPLGLQLMPRTRDRVGGSGLVTNPADLIRWGRAVEARLFPGLYTDEGLIGSFREDEYEGRPYFRAQGTTRGYAAGVTVFPQEGISVAYVSNAETWITLGIENVLVPLAFGEALQPALPNLSPSPLSSAHEALTGAYVHPQFGPIEVVRIEDDLWLRLAALSADFYLTPLADGGAHWLFLNTVLRPTADGLNAEQHLQLQSARSFDLPRV
jgi:CubicO group peptidase (beta-lactamase class C family)